MITDDIYPEDMTERDWKRLQKEGRTAGLTLAGIGAVTYGANKFVGPTGYKGGARVYKRIGRYGKGAIATGLGGAGLLEYAHYKRRKKDKGNDSKKKD